MGHHGNTIWRMEDMVFDPHDLTASRSTWEGAEDKDAAGSGGTVGSNEGQGETNGDITVFSQAKGRAKRNSNICQVTGCDFRVDTITVQLQVMCCAVSNIVEHMDCSATEAR